VKVVEDRIKSTDYKGTLTALQRLEINDIVTLLAIANQFWKKDHEPKRKKS
jgi:hypothetical protein